MSYYVTRNPLGATKDSLEPPKRKGMNTGMLVGWGAVILLTAGIYYATTREDTLMAPNRRRRRRTSRRTSRRGKRRTSRRRQTRRNKLTAAERRRIPKSKFVFPERRAWPLDSKKRAKAAVSYMHMGRVASASDFNKIRNAIRKRYPDVWEDYGKGLTWQKVKKAKSKRRRSRSSRKKAA